MYVATKPSSAKNAASGEARTGKRPSRPRKTATKRRPKKVTVMPGEPQPKNPLEANASQRSASLLPGVESLFQRPLSQSSKPEESEIPGGEASSASENEDVAAKLDAVPDEIGGEEEASPEGAEGGIGADDITQLMGSIAFEEQDVKDALGEVFDWIGERMQSDHWRLTERQARMLGKPTAQLLNSIWQKLMQRMPDVIAQWCEDTPGATAFLVSFGIVVVPKATRQMTITKHRRQRRREPEKAEPTEHPKAEPQAAGADGIPTASGIVGRA